ncbi:MAG: HTTM domain-containing protein [Bradymonadia bacterium]
MNASVENGVVKKSIFNWRAWITVDPRSLAVFRVAFGLLCLIDLWQRWPHIAMLYTNEGVLPNHYALYMTGEGPQRLSLLYMLDEVWEVKVFFLATAGILMAFVAGWRTRLFQVLGMICMISIHNRNWVVHIGADIVHNLWWLWTIALPLGRSWSVDAWLAARKGVPLETLRAPIRSLAITGFMMQLAVIYFFNTIHKTGDTWMKGEAVYWLLHQDRILTDFGFWFRGWAPMSVLWAMSWGTLIVEGLAPILIWSPFAVVWCRRVLVVSLIGLHLSIAAVTDLSLFSYMMSVSYMLLLTSQDCDLLGRFGRWLAGKLGGAWLAIEGAMRSVGLWLEAHTHVRDIEVPDSPKHHPVRFWAAQVFVVVAFLSCFHRAMDQNRALRKTFPDHKMPTWANTFSHYGDFQQGWQLFAPDAPVKDGWMIVDAELDDGTHIDPRTGEVPNLDQMADARLRHWTHYEENLMFRLQFQKHLFAKWAVWFANGEHQRGLIPPGKDVVAFTAWWISDVSPAPGTGDAPIFERKRKIYSWKAKAGPLRSK